MKLGVLVFNLGGPESLRDVKPFLYRLFSDPEIIRIKWAPLRKAVAYTIATLRKRKSQGYYAQIGGGLVYLKAASDIYENIVTRQLKPQTLFKNGN